jgi:hypothetical protein
MKIIRSHLGCWTVRVDPKGFSHLFHTHNRLSPLLVPPKSHPIIASDQTPEYCQLNQGWVQDGLVWYSFLYTISLYLLPVGYNDKLSRPPHDIQWLARHRITAIHISAQNGEHRRHTGISSSSETQLGEPGTSLGHSHTPDSVILYHSWLCFLGSWFFSLTHPSFMKVSMCLQLNIFLNLLFFLQYWGLNSGPTP